ncbi:MAG: AtpZ/AtpI family protein [Pirellula sp.]|nr:AtpZ/AtpI family protein [Pirellula sp.]
MSEGNQSSEEEESYSETDLARIEAQGNTNAISRAVSVMVLMVIPGVAGHYLDRWFGTRFLVLVGFVMGICLAVFGLLYVAKIADLTAKQNRERKLRMKSRTRERS